MPSRELMRLLDARGVDYSKCIEKSELRALAALTAAGGGGGGEECAICLDVLQQPQTMPCGHCFCRVCVASMRHHGVGEAQVCPLCRGPMPDAERMYLEGRCLLEQYCRWKRDQRDLAPLLPQAQQLVLSKAVALMRGVMAIDPEHAGCATDLSYALYAGGDDDGAISQYRTSAAALKHANAHYNQGTILDKRGDKRGAEAAQRAAIAADPQHANAHCNLGGLLADRGDHVGAEAAFRAAIAADPHYAMPLANLGSILGQRGDFVGCARASEAALEIASEATRSSAAVHAKSCAMAKTNLACAKANLQIEEQNWLAATLKQHEERSANGGGGPSVFITSPVLTRLLESPGAY
jgi:tetratricopeptide (TPR) repeat protein